MNNVYCYFCVYCNRVIVSYADSPEVFILFLRVNILNAPSLRAMTTTHCRYHDGVVSQLERAMQECGNIVRCLDIASMIQVRMVSSSLNCNREIILHCVQLPNFTFDRSIPWKMAADRSLIKSALSAFQGCQDQFEALWASVCPELQQDDDVMAFACSRVQDWMYSRHVPSDTKSEAHFIKLIVEYTISPGSITYWESEDLGFPLVPDELLVDNRKFALTCAAKGFSPFGCRKDLLWTVDEDVVFEYLTSSDSCCFTLTPTILSTAKARRAHILTKSPLLAVSFLSHEDNQSDARELIEVVARSTIPFLIRSNFSQSLWASLWRIAAMKGMLKPCCVFPSDTDGSYSDAMLVASMFNDDRFIQFRCSPFAAVESVARLVFTKNGMQIKESLWIDNKELGMIAVKQNGCALQYLTEQLRSDVDVTLTAVQQTWMAITWVSSVASDAHLQLLMIEARKQKK